MYTYTCDGEIEAEEQILYKYKKQLVEDYESKFEKRMLYMEILNQIKKLSDKERYILENLYIKDRTQVSIAQELGCSNTAVGKIKKNAIKKIRKGGRTLRQCLAQNSVLLVPHPASIRTRRCIYVRYSKDWRKAV